MCVRKWGEGGFRVLICSWVLRNCTTLAYNYEYLFRMCLIKSIQLYIIYYICMCVWVFSCECSCRPKYRTKTQKNQSKNRKQQRNTCTLIGYHICSEYFVAHILCYFSDAHSALTIHRFLHVLCFFFEYVYIPARLSCLIND